MQAERLLDLKPKSPRKLIYKKSYSNQSVTTVTALNNTVVLQVSFVLQ